MKRGSPYPPPRDAASAAPPVSNADEVVELETEWHRLRLELDRARDQLHTIQSTARGADMAADAVVREGPAEIRVLEPAFLPLHAEHGRGRLFFIGAAAALFVAAGFAVARVLLNETLLDETDVIALGGPPVLISIPHAAPVKLPPPSAALVQVVAATQIPSPMRPAGGRRRPL